MPQSEGGYKLFKIGDLFEKVETKALKYKVKELPVQPIGDYTLPALTAGIENQGLSCYVPREGASILKNVISVSAYGANTGAMFYQPNEFTVLQDSYAIKLSKRELNIWNALFLIAALEKVIRKYYDWSNKAGWNKIKELSISLPANKDGDVDFELIETYVQKIEQERIHELETYIQALGFDDYTLTPAEQKAIKEIKAYRPLPVGTIFEKPSLSFKKKVFKKKEDISTEKTNEFNLPLVNAKHGQNGIMYYGREQDFDSIEMGIDIVNDGAVSTGDVYPQPQKTGVLYNAYLIRFKDFSPTDSILMFMSAVIEKSIKLKFSYQNKAGWEKVKDCLISVPVSADGSIDYAFMENYINAIKKQTIARVKEYIDSEYKTEEQLLEEIQPTITPLHIHDTYQPGRIPLYTLRAACGYFDDGQLPEEEGWIDATGQGFTPDKDRYFAVHAKGDSMLPKIHDGDICIFEWYHAGSRNGEIVLSQSSEYDDAYGGRYTIKRYYSEKAVTDEGWQHAKVELQPLNADFDPIVIEENDDVRTIGIFKCVLD